MTKGFPVEEAGPAINRLLAEAAGRPVTLTRDNLAVGYLFTPETLESWLETREILTDPSVMQAIADDQAGLVKFHSLEEVEQLLGDEA